jgi:hypothetical protein
MNIEVEKQLFSTSIFKIEYSTFNIFKFDIFGRLNN